MLLEFGCDSFLCYHSHILAFSVPLLSLEFWKFSRRYPRSAQTASPTAATKMKYITLVIKFCGKCVFICAFIHQSSTNKDSQTSNIGRNKSETLFLVSSCSCLCSIFFSQVLSQEWRCSWSSADSNLIAQPGATYIRGLMVFFILLWCMTINTMYSVHCGLW